MDDKIENNNIAVHTETDSSAPQKFKFSSKTKEQDGDVALALFANAQELVIDPGEEENLVRKIDWVILPLILVNYAFFYIDKTTLSYAAIFGVKQDLKLHGTQYSWLSSMLMPA